ncbi:MAG: EamA family transporter [Dehalococcoidia bacterium]
MSGSLFALFGAGCFGLSAIFTRRGVVRSSDSSAGVLISLFLAVPYFTLILAGMGQTGEIGAFPLSGYIFLASAGLVHFVVGRSLYYRAIQAVGANMAQILTSAGPLCSVAWGILLFHEPLTWELVSGSGLIISGVLFIVWGPLRAGNKIAASPGEFIRGVLAGLGAGVLYGSSPVLVKWGLGAAGAPVAGTFISYVAATTVMSFTLLHRGQRDGLMGIDRTTLLWFSLSGTLVASAQLFRYMALSLSPMSVVGPLFSASRMLVIFFSFIFNRKLETFSPRVLLGAALVVSGTVILF